MTMRKILVLGGILAAGCVWAHPLDTAFLKGVCDHERALYAPGEEIVFTLRLQGLSGARAGHVVRRLEADR